MPRFTYKAKSGPEKTVEGEMLAENEAAAVEKIEKMGHVPIWIREADSGAGKPEGGLAIQRVTKRDVNVFTRQLASLIKSGVPILRAMRTVRDQSGNRRFRRVVGELQAMVRDGKMLSAALSRYPRIFPELYVNMVRSGESAGALDVVLLQLAEAREKEEAFRRKVQGALAYPSLVLAVGLLTVILMLTVFIPKLSALFSTFKELPLPTRILMRISEFSQDYWLWALVPLVILAFLYQRAISTARGRAMADAFMLKIPLLGVLTRDADIARFSRTMALLIRAGVPVEKGLSLSAGALSNTVLKSEMLEVKDKSVRQGMSITAGLRSAEHFPVFVLNMAAVGEESGTLDESLSDVAVFYEAEVERRVAVATSLLEPVLILVIGAMVGFLVFAMLLPIFAITRTIG